MNDDARVRRDVESELRSDTRVGLSDLRVAVAAGVVTLSGDVDSWARRHAAQSAALRVHGVLSVTNALVVSPPGTLQRSDAQIARVVHQMLEWDVRVPRGRTQISVAQGVVTIMGNVSQHSQRDDIEQAVRYLAGVLSVKNLLTVSAPAATTDVQAAVAESLARQSNREAGAVEVAVVNGRASVTGKVGSWPEHRAVLGAVGATPGVCAIDDQLRTA